jgi:2,4-dienoyl-CoA reductase-like NADH-dependent reductase (Old Yellow Enzyme family)
MPKPDPFSPFTTGTLSLQNRLVRSATLEGGADEQGCPGKDLKKMYGSLMEGGLGAIVTGFTAVSPDGRAMQPGQLALYSAEHLVAHRAFLSDLPKTGTKILTQLAHTGRQTSAEALGSPVRGLSRRPSVYFRNTPQPYSTEEIPRVIQDFIYSAQLAQEAGYHGVQLHAAHGYFLHQSISPRINNRRDQYGQDPQWSFGTKILRDIVLGIRETCGSDFPLWIKISGGSDHKDFANIPFNRLARFLNTLPLDLIEVSYGSMENPFSIIRGKTLPTKEILRINPHYRRKTTWGRKLARWFLTPFLKPFVKSWSPHYNVGAAEEVLQESKIPLMSVGGHHNLTSIQGALEKGFRLVSLCRPLIAEPDFAKKIKADPQHNTACVYCNLCTVYCDKPGITRCYRRTTAS